MRFTKLAVLALAASCGRTEPYLPPRPCQPAAASRPCHTACGDGTETCVAGYWGVCSAPAPLAPPERLSITGTLRDFRASHPDFEDAVGDDRGLVEATLGRDGTPVYAHPGNTRTVTGPLSFAEWFHDAPGVNRSMPHALVLTRVSEAPLVYSFASDAFFPLDGALFGNEGNPHNFHFTLELHTRLEYRGGETLAFQGDDDLLVFVADRLALDLGGAHPTQTGSIALDALGLTRGSVYPLDVFFAERHTSSSTLRVETTNARFVRCP